MKRKLVMRVVIGMGALLVLAGCAAGGEQFTAEQPAGFWVGLWHGVISVITLIVGIFSDSLKVYEVNNSGGLYDFGFLLGVICVWGSCASGGGKCKWKSKEDREKEKTNEKDWEEIGEKVEEKVKRKAREWADADKDADWKEVEEKVEEKVKDKIKNWAEDGDESEEKPAQAE